MYSKLAEIYYQPENHWAGRNAITMLREATKLPLNQVKAWFIKTSTVAGSYTTSEAD